jgi:L-threonylcarbamoyladenylate synthase
MSVARIFTIGDPGGCGAALGEAARIVGRGGVVAHPTETVYGLAVDPWNAAAVARLVSFKGREGKSGLIVIVADLEQARTMMSSPTPPPFELLAAGFWPGPLTLIVPAAAGAPVPVLGPSGGIAIRLTSDPVARALIAAAGRALVSTSANLTGRPPAGTGAEAAAELGDRIDLVLDAGPRSSSAPSTIVDLTGDRPTILREGAVPRSRIESALQSLRAIE